MSETTIYHARAVITLNSDQQRASHIAVRDGHILAVGGPELDDLWGTARRDDRFGDHVLMPGFVEGHAHLMAGAIWNYVYLGYHDRLDPDGILHPGLTSLAEVMARLHDIAADGGNSPLICWGFDPIFLPDDRLHRDHLDRISTRRSIVVLHSNFHLMTVNTAVLQQVDYFAMAGKIAGIGVDRDGVPNGELREMAAMFPIWRRLKIDFRDWSGNPDAVASFGRVAQRVGVTTVTDLFADLTDPQVEILEHATSLPDCPIRLVPALNALGAAPSALVARIEALRARSHASLRLGAAKLMTDGSIQGYTARLKWPGYFNGAANGLWNMPRETLFEVVDVLHRAGVAMHIHTNGDEASEAALDALAAAMAQTPYQEHRAILQHCQMADQAQFRRMARLGVGVNLFTNHLWYFGDQHRDHTLGPDRARRMDACRWALENGVTMAIHSDAPVTPMGPLFTAWCAVNRMTMSGDVLGEGQRITPLEALRAITLGAAETLSLDSEIGSIEVGKRADIAVLDADPLAANAPELRDIKVLGTMIGGRIFMV